MIQFNLLIDYITSLLAEDPLEFDHKKYIFIKLLSDLKSLEKYNKLIIAIQKRIFEADIAEKYLGSDINKSNNILIYYKEPLNLKPKQSRDQIFKKNKVTIESKNKLLNILNTIDLNQRMLQKKSERETYQIQHKNKEFLNVLHSSLDIKDQLLLLNTINSKKVSTIVSQMKSIEAKLQNRNTVFKLTVNDLNECLTNISKELILDFSFDNSKKEYINGKLYKDFINSESNLSIAYYELANIISSVYQTNILKPLKIISQNEHLIDINLPDTMITYNITRQNYINYTQQIFDIVATVNTLLTNLNYMESEFDENLRNIIQLINNNQNKHDVITQILKRLNYELNELNNDNSIMAYNQLDANLEVKLIENNIINLDDKIHDCNTQLTSINKKNETLRGDLQHLDLLFNITFQKYINQLNGTQQIVLLDKKSSSKPVLVLYKEIKTAKKNYNELLIKRNEIMMDKFNKKKYAMELEIGEKSQNIIKTTHNTNIYYKDKIKQYSQFKIDLNDLNVSLEKVNNDIFLIYHDIIIRNHGKDLKQLEAEEIELKTHTNLYDKEIIELGKEEIYIENNSKLIILNIKHRIEDLKVKLLQITNINKGLEIEFNTNKIL